MDLRRDALQMFNAALEAADAGNAVRHHFSLNGACLQVAGRTLDLDWFQRVRLVAVGKAAVAMAAAVQQVLGGRLSDAIVVTKYGHAGALPRQWTYVEASHPLPDAEGLQAGEKVRAFVSDNDERDLLIVAVSGGASALLPAPVNSVSLRDKQVATELLLRAGADIGELNAVRKHLSYLKGGRLAALAYPATILGLLLSDVIGDRLDVIGSGLTSPDPSTFAEALNVVGRYKLREAMPATVMKHLERADVETPKANNPVFERVRNVVVGSNRLALKAVAAKALELGYRVSIMATAVEGETRIVAGQFVRRGVLENGPLCLLAGGETTVHVRGTGKGGRNQEFALASAIAIDGIGPLAVLSGGTDGTDGPTDAAGAIALGDTVTRAKALGLDVQRHLDNNDSYPVFDALGDLIRTGPTGTNVMDVHILLSLKEGE